MIKEINIRIAAALGILSQIREEADGDQEKYDAEVDGIIKLLLENGDTLSAQIWETRKAEVWENNVIDNLVI